jgi:hypothetical protein
MKGVCRGCGRRDELTGGLCADCDLASIVAGELVKSALLYFLHNCHTMKVHITDYMIGYTIYRQSGFRVKRSEVRKAIKEEGPALGFTVERVNARGRTIWTAQNPKIIPLPWPVEIEA